MNDPGDIPLTHTGTPDSRPPCSIISIIPTIGMSSCRGRAEAFARSLSSKLRTLGSQVNIEKMLNTKSIKQRFVQSIKGIDQVYLQRHHGIKGHYIISLHNTFDDYFSTLFVRRQRASRATSYALLVGSCRPLIVVRSLEK